MDEQEKKLLEALKNFNLSKLYLPKTYVDLEFKDFYPCYILNIDSEGKYNIYIPARESSNIVPKNMLRFYGENDHFENYKIKTTIINPELINDETTDIIGSIKIKLKN